MPTLTIDATGEPIAEELENDDVTCRDCGDEKPADEMNGVDGDHVCESCYENYYSCYDCDDLTHGDDTHTVSGGNIVCESCLDNYYSCEDCSEYVHGDYTNTVGYDRTVCESCLDAYSYCDGCGEYYNPDYGRCCNNDCDCEAPAQSFSFPNVTTGDALANDTRAPMTLAEGFISDVGLAEIARLIRGIVPMPTYREQYKIGEDGNYILTDDGMTYVKTDEYVEYLKYASIASDVLDGTIDPEWQTSGGNFTKRLSRHAYQTQGVKLDAGIVSKIGNIARDNSKGIAVEFELTRNLNMSAGEFYHEDSCWWSDYSESRCALKNNGGLGLRTFKTETYEAYDYQIGPWAHNFGRAYTPVGMREHEVVSGRAWVMPVRRIDNRWMPTFDTETADGYIVFNGYGDLDGYNPARIVAALTGMKYVKIGFSSEPMYVNAGGYLVTSEDLLSDAGIGFDLDTHANLYNREKMMTNA